MWVALGKQIKTKETKINANTLNLWHNIVKRNKKKNNEIV